MTITATDITTIATISRAEAPALAEEEYRRWADALATLAADDWSRPTDCEGWTVRDMAGHVLGAMRAAASVREQMRQQREIAKRVERTGDNQVDVMTALQIEWTADRSSQDLARETETLVEAAARGRKRVPGPLRRFVRADVEIGPIAETWRLGYLLDTILTRDILMHRIDLARAVGVSPDLGGPHAHRLVSDIVAEWARRHEQPFELTLNGDAGGSFRAGTDGETLELETVEFLRILSGRGTGAGLLAQQVPF